MKNSKGITLIELVVGMGILSVVGLMVASLLASSVRMYRSTVTYADLQTECQSVSRRVSNVLINAVDLYFEETEEGMYLFTGTITDGADKSIYAGPIIWFNKKTNCLYENDSVSIEAAGGTRTKAGSAPPGGDTIATSSTSPLTAELVKAALEGGDGSDLREYLISDKVRKVEIAISPRLKQIDTLFYTADRPPTFHYSITAGTGENDDYTVTSSVTPRNRIGRLHFEGGREIGAEEEIK